MSRMLYLWVSLLLPLILTSACPAFAQARTGSVSQFKLESHGWQVLPKEQRGEWAGTSSKLVSIDHHGRVLVGFAARDNGGLATREHPGLSFHILRFTQEGNVDLSFVLPTNSLFRNGLYLGPNDQIFARANDAFQWFSEEDGNRQEGAHWWPLVPCPGDCQISQSPSRRTLIVNTYSKLPSERDYNHGIRTLTMLDLSSSPPRVVQNCNSGGRITDKFSYGYNTDDYIWARRPLCDREHSEELPLDTPDTRGGEGYALNDEALLFLGTGKDSRGVELIALDGQVKFRKELPKHDSAGSPWFRLTSADERGDRFAFTVESWRGGSRLLDISGNRVARRVVVYTETGQELASIPVSKAYHRDFDFAMSPDGHLLAILDESVVTVANIE